ncbi:type II toxin-antitoxin system RelE/ParE family toxin [Rhizobium sp. LjRoot254]|uniref:type II toxin-antitoxin system RelE/ParE family toxin n=1 Tax=Rhizobium sp. LjRoot254 TaxID=3342297 RepID=UPI003ED0F8C1
MIYKVVFRKKAIADLEGLYEYIRDREKSPLLALNYVTRIKVYCEGFSQFPERGTQRDDIRHGLRVVGFERRVLIVFEVSGDIVRIGHIFYGGRDYERLLRSLYRSKQG